MSIWSKKGLESPVPPVEASGNALQTSRICHIENLLFGFYSNTSDLKRMRTFVAKRHEMSKIRAFWYLSDLKRIRTFVAKRREMLKIRAFWYL